jgi:tryptophan halogenase
MAPALSPSSRFRRRPGAQAAPLPDGRWLVRHAAGASVLGGPAVGVLPKILEMAEAGLTAWEICTALAPAVPEAAGRQLLASLLGEMLEVITEPPVAAGAVLVLGAGPAATAVARLLADEGFAVAAASADRAGEPAALGTLLPAAEVVVAILEETPYTTLFDLQRAGLAAGVPSLFVTADPDGLRIGPFTIPGMSPCLACAQLAALGFLGLATEPLLATAGAFRTGSVDPSTFAETGRLVAAVVRSAHPEGHSGGDPALIEGQTLLTGDQRGQHGRRTLPVARFPTCPLCGGVAPAIDGPRGDLVRRAGRRLVEAAERRPSPRAHGPESEPEGLVRSIGILGGGTAGYLAALALRRKHPGLAVTLIESPDVPVIGVGEATTPLLPQFLHVDLGLDPGTLFRAVQPTLKLGIRFLWGRPGTGDFPYPFGPVAPFEAAAWDGDLGACSLQALLMAAGAVPLYREGPESAADGGWRPAFGTAVAYHLDNQRFVAYLERQATAAGVEHVKATVVEVERSPDGSEVQAVVDRDGRRFSYDLWIDASGFRSLLLEGTLGSPWVSFGGSLWTDRAVVAPVPLGGPPQPYTTAETMSCGWCWSTPQSDADHRGYVFASAFQSAEDAEAEMRRGNPGMGEARLVRFRAGRHGEFWKGNVVALGNSYGFVEPLESTALHMLVRQIGLLVQAFPLRRGERGLPGRLNGRVAAWWDYLAWFLALHYRFNRRSDSPFWRACREKVDVSSHGALLDAFRERGPLARDPALAGAVDFPDPLWGPEGIDLLLLGQEVAGRRPRPALPRSVWEERQRLARAAVARAAGHAHALALLGDHPELLRRFIEPFRAAGPAFPVVPVV